MAMSDLEIYQRSLAECEIRDNEMQVVEDAVRQRRAVLALNILNWKQKIEEEVKKNELASDA